MNTISSGRQINFSTVIMFVLGFWLSASVVLDFVVIPSLSMAGMMNQDSFPMAGFMLFGIFNHIELLCAGIVLTGFLFFYRSHYLDNQQEFLAVGLASVLLAIALVYTYVLTPQMSGLGLNLNLFDSHEAMSGAMVAFHQSYWILEIVKFCVGAILLRWCYRSSLSLD